jgi:outer membrane lipoprotein-sorting protein
MTQIRIWLSALLILVVTVAGAQPTNTQGTSDAKALDVLKKVSAKYKGYTSFQGKYSLRIQTPEEDMDEEQNGTFYMKGKQFKLVNEMQQIICNGKTIWYYLTEVEEVQVNAYEPDESTITPDQIFYIYDKQFLSLHTGYESSQGIKMHVIELTPIDKSKPYFKIKLYISTATNEIRMAKVFDKNGNRYTYSMTQLKANPTLAADFFIFDPKKHPGVEVVDLR